MVGGDGGTDLVSLGEAHRDPRDDPEDGEADGLRLAKVEDVRHRPGRREGKKASGTRFNFRHFEKTHQDLVTSTNDGRYVNVRKNESCVRVSS